MEDDAELIGPLVIGDDCVIGAGAVLSGVIHWDGGKTGRGASAVGGIIGRGVRIHHGATIGDGAVIGDGTDVAAGAVVPLGARIRPHTRVAAESGSS